MNKRLVLIAVLLLVLALIGAYFFYFRSDVVSHEFKGKILSADNSSITAQGNFVSPEDLSILEPDLKTITASVSNQTRITKLIIYLPS